MSQAALIIIGTIVVWAVSGAAVALGLWSLYGVEWFPQCSTLNIAIGLILLQLVTRNERGRKHVYEGSREEDQLNLGIVMLVAVPTLLIMLGLLWWLFGQFMAP